MQDEFFLVRQLCGVALVQGLQDRFRFRTNPFCIFSGEKRTENSKKGRRMLAQAFGEVIRRGAGRSDASVPTIFFSESMTYAVVDSALAIRKILNSHRNHLIHPDSAALCQ